MKKARVTKVIMAVVLVGLTAMSCKDGREQSQGDAAQTEMNHEDMTAPNDMTDNNAQTTDAQQVLADYMILKEALVTTNTDDVGKAGKKLESTLNGFDISGYTAEQQEELRDIVADAKEHAEHIGKSEMGHQREHFKTLSKDMIDMVAITGTDGKMYQMFCPMYEGGSPWLSMEKEIKNPYYGSKMMTCGKVQREIN